MKKYVLLLSALWISTVIYAQEAKEIIGTWEVTAAELSEQLTLEEEARRQFAPFIAAFEGSKFEFKKNGKSTFYTRIPQFAYQNLEWSWDGAYITLRESKNSAATMQLAVANHEENWLFYIMETPFVLTVTKK